MKESLLAARRVLSLCLLLSLGGAAHAAVATLTNVIFSDNFEAGLGLWTITSPQTTLNISPAGSNAVPAGGQFSAQMVNSSDRMHHNIIADNGGVELTGPALFTCWIYDNSGTASRIFNEVRGYSGGTGLPNGGTVASGTLAQLLAIGKYNTVTLPGEVFNGTKYQARVTFGANAGWFNLNAAGSPNRSTGWHRFDIERLADLTTINCYVDGILSRTITGATPEPWDCTVLGPGLGTTAGNAWIDGMRVATLSPAPAVNITCPPNLTLAGTGPGGATVGFFVSAGGGCTAPTISCVPASGANFPIGTTTVNCTASDACSQTANCSFTVKVLQPGGPEVFALTNNLPPAAGEYVSPAQWHQLYANGIIISNASHDRFVNPGISNVIYGPPGPGGSNSHPFNSTANFQISADNGVTFQTVSAPASVVVGVGHVGTVLGKDYFATEMQSFNIQGGSLPPGVMIRESPTLASTGQTTVRQVAGGYLIGSFFDIFTEISLDGGASWSTSSTPVHVELKKSLTGPDVPEPTDLLPPPNDQYVSPDQWHALYAVGIVISNVSHSGFLQSYPAGGGTGLPGGGTNTENFGSTVDMKISLDGGATFTAARVSAPVTVTVADAGSGTYDTEMTSLSLSGGDLPAGVMIRESPTLPSRGRVRVTPVAGGTYKISSFFDIFTELSTDGGASWNPATNGPVHMELHSKAPEQPFGNPNLPPAGQYVSPQQWHAYFAMGIVISNVSHMDFLQNQPPPPPGGSQAHNFGSAVQMLVSMNGGATFNPITAPANVLVNVSSTTKDTATTRFFDTEMLALSIQGGGLPPGIMIRESPSKASLGRTSIRQAGPGDFRVSSFFDIFPEISVDGGQNWFPSLSGPATVSVRTLGGATLGITCPPALSVVSAAPIAVSYPAPIIAGGCAPVTVACNPPSGSTFPLGTTTVLCIASDPCGGSANCTFNVTVVQPPPEIFFPTPNLPPPAGVYISPALYHQLYANGIIISNISHSKFTQSQPPPPVGGAQVHAFGSAVEMEISTDGGQTFQKYVTPCNSSVQVMHIPGGPPDQYNNEMLQLDISGGSLPPGVMLRESPTLQSTGQTTVRPVNGGYLISSFFDIFTELSLDGGATWSPAQQAAHVELRRDITLVPPVSVPTGDLPPRNGAYVSPTDYHILTAQGVVISNVSHSFFTDSQPPPPVGGTATHAFNSQVDMQLSLDNGGTFQSVRAPAAVSVKMDALTGGHIDTEMLALDIQGGGLPAGVMIRESPSLPSRGGASVARSGLPPGDPDFDLLRIGSFFDIFIEVSLDGGATWAAAAGPAHVQLVMPAPEQPATNSNMPPLNGEYISPDKWHQLYANGIIISNASHDRFTQTQPPPPPGGSQVHNFGSQVHFDLFQPGQLPLHVTAPAGVSALVSSSQDTPNTRFFDTEMLALNIGGGSLPAGVMVRESPSKASLGRTSVRSTPGDAANPYRIGSFFDIFTEISLDGGATWSPAVSGPVSVHLNIPGVPLGITCPPPVFVTSTIPVAVTYPAPTVVGGCAPVTMVCNPPSGSIFPVGITVVNCAATDSCGAAANCSFDLVVRSGDPCLDPGTNGTVTLPPTGCQYLSPDQVHMIIDGLPPGTTIELATIHKDFICHQSGGPPVCTNDCFTVDDCNPANGATEQFDSALKLQLAGTGLLNGWVRNITLPNVFCQSQVGPRMPGSPLQSFDTDMQQIQGQITGDPDFDLLRITAGTGFGLPSPGHTTLTRQGPPGSPWAVDSFFDITYRIDFVGAPGGALAGRSGSTTGTIRMMAVPKTNSPVLTLTCPPNKIAAATAAVGAVVTYPAPTVVGGCAPVSVVCNPPSGSTFPIGTTTVTCIASDACGHNANCTFTVTVRPRKPQWFPDPVLPPPQGEYISPEKWHQLYANGIIISNVSHRRFVQNFPPPPAGGSATHTFGSSVELQMSTDGGNTFLPLTGSADVTVKISHAGGEADGTQIYDTEMLALSLTTPAGIRVRESPTKASLGRTTIQSNPGGGVMISSFFDVFTEISLDDGQTWSPAPDAALVELGMDSRSLVPVTTPTPLLPPPDDVYVSPQQYHLLLAQGIVIRNVRHKFFTGSQPPPPPGPAVTHSFDSQVDMELSTDGGQTFQPRRAPAVVTVRLQHRGTAPDGTQVYDTEMLQLDVQGGDLPPAVRLRESPTRQSLGGAAVAQGPYPSPWTIGSFFDIFTEVSLDGGQSWSPASGAAHVEVQKIANPHVFASPNLPPLDGQYVSPAQWHALYAQGIIISNVSHKQFTQTFPPPPPGVTETHSFSSAVECDLSLNNGQTWQHTTLSAQVTVSLRESQSSGDTRYFETEMLALNIQGGGVPPTFMLRESPSKASLGRTSLRLLDPASGQYEIDSFFDIFTELSTDGGQSWSPSLSGPATVALAPLPFAPFTLNCPSNITVTASGPSGEVVNYVVSYLYPDCPFGPFTVTCVPPSGSVFPVGTTTVTCTGSDGCGEHPSCSFNVTVNPATAVPAPEYFFPQPLLPPAGSVYISPALWHALFAQGIVIRDVRHRFFTQHYPLPPLGTSQTHTFGSEVDYQVSLDNGNSFQPGSGTANVTVQVTHTQDAGGTSRFDTEMLALDLNGGGFMLRESPTLHSTGQTTVRPVAGGYMISSFFDVFPELSLDGGATWSPAQQSGHVEMHPDPLQVTPVGEPTPLLPPPNGAYVSPQLWHALFAQGIVIRNVSHKFFTGALPPPPAGGSNTHSFNSQVDLQVSTDGGNTYQYVRAAAPVTVSVANHGSSANTIYDTEMLQLSLTLPNGVMLRESPTLPSRGQTQIDAQADGTYRVGSFFDIFPEVSLDGGASWSPTTNGPVRMQLTTPAPEIPKPTPNLPPLDGQYVSPAQWHALYANGIIITNVSHDRFTQTQPPPPPGGSQTENFGSRVSGQISMNGGASFTPFQAPASVAVAVNSRADLDTGPTRFFDTEMLALSLQGGSLPAGIMVRESPSKASLGRTSVRTSAAGYLVSSFFDVFTEVSLDGGATWSPTVTAPGTMGLATNAAVCVGPASLKITRSADGTSVTISWTGAGFRLQSTTALTGSATTVWTDVPGTSGVTLPVQPGVSKFYRVICP